MAWGRTWDRSGETPTDLFLSGGLAYVSLRLDVPGVEICMGMTETMRVLKALCGDDVRTLDQVAEAADIPTSRAVAALGTLLRAQDAAQCRGPAGTQYTATDAGRTKAASWDVPPARSPRGMRRD